MPCFRQTHWYATAADQNETFQTSDGHALLATQVQNLVNAMAGFSPPAAGQTTLPTTQASALEPVIAANWH